MGLSGALGTSEAPRKPLPEALPSGLSRARLRSNARVGASESTPGGSPQWPVVRTPTLQRTRKRKYAVKRTVFFALQNAKNAVKRVVLGASETTPGGFPQRPAVRLIRFCIYLQHFYLIFHVFFSLQIF